MWISAIAVALSYNSYNTTKAKFRLDLFEKRYAIYEELIKFSGKTLQEGKIEEAAIESAHKSFRGLNYHASKFLFGKDISNYFDEINKAFAGSITADGVIKQGPYSPEYQKWVEIKHKSLQKICAIPDEAPKLFAPYLYFGDVKNT